ncbi:unnamed protein product [Symbiodinium sp. CCMP2456]|nr:unnamed protein product [Symbiodinium sp. CCMP2456]
MPRWALRGPCWPYLDSGSFHRCGDADHLRNCEVGHLEGSLWEFYCLGIGRKITIITSNVFPIMLPLSLSLSLPLFYFTVTGMLCGVMLCCVWMLCCDMTCYDMECSVM